MSQEPKQKFAVAMLSIKSDGYNVSVVQFVCMVEAVSHEEATGIGHAMLAKLKPGWSHSVKVCTDQNVCDIEHVVLGTGKR